MNGKLDVKKWIYASIVVFVVLSILEFAVTRTILGPIMPDPENIMILRLWNYLGRAVFSLMFAFIFTKGYEGKPGVGEGARYGLWIGLLIFVPALFGNLITTTYPAGMLVTRTISGIVEAMICGICLGLVYKGSIKKTAT